MGEKGFDDGKGVFVFHGQHGRHEVEVVGVQDGRRVPAVPVGQGGHRRVVEEVVFRNNSAARDQVSSLTLCYFVDFLQSNMGCKKVPF